MRVRMKNNNCIAKKTLVVFLISLLLTASVWLSFIPVAYAAGYEGDTEESPAEATGLLMDADELELFVADSHCLTVSVTPEEAACPPLTWMSSDELVAVVDEDGLVTAVGEGRAVITATAGELFDTCDVIVKPALGVALELLRSEVTLAQNDSLALEYNLITEDVNAAALNWSSSAPAVAAVDGSGQVTACSPGTATISVSAGNVQSTCDVLVVPSEILSDKYIIDRDNGLLKGVWTNTTVDEFRTWLDNDAVNIEVYKDSQPHVSGHVGTGMIVRLVVNNEVKDQLKVQIVGDINGDGIMGLYEYTLARLHLLGAPAAAAEPELLDINGDGRISITDYILIRLEVLGLNPDGDNLSGFPDEKPVISAKASGCSAIIAWSAVPGAAGYEISRAADKNGPYQALAQVKGSASGYMDSSLALENTYHYRATAFCMLGDTKIYSQSSNTVSVSTPGYTVYYQGDPQWKFPSSVRKAACVVSAFAITINNMGINATPRTVYESNGSRTPMNMDNLKKNFGVKPVSGLATSSKYLSGFNGVYTYLKSPASNLEAAVKEALARHPEGVILYFKKGSDAHAIVACKVSGGNIFYSDPGRNRTTLVDFANTWCKVGHNMSYKHLVYMVALDRA